MCCVKPVRNVIAMELLSANVGSYPKIGEGPEKQRHRQAYARWEKGEISQEEFDRIQDDVTSEVIEEQVRARLDIVTDGQIRWYDPISHIARKLDGCEINGLLRFFDTNFYFRQPVITGEIERRESILRREFEFARRVSPRPVKPVLTGPYTLARLSIDRRSFGIKRLVEEFSGVICEEVGDLVQAGAKLIQVDEPAIVANPGDLEILAAAMDELSGAGKGAEMMMHLYFGDASRIYAGLLDLPVDTLSLDFTYGSGLLKEVSERGCDKNLGLGVIDGRNTMIEDEEDIRTKVTEVLEGFSGSRVYLSPSCGLEYLPREVAFKKLQNMVAIAARIKEEIA